MQVIVGQLSALLCELSGSPHQGPSVPTAACVSQELQFLKPFTYFLPVDHFDPQNNHERLQTNCRAVSPLCPQLLALLDFDASFCGCYGG